MNELMSVRVGFELMAGNGWLRPVLMSGDWPLARLGITKEWMEVSLTFAADTVRVFWTEVDEIEAGWTGTVVRYQVAGEPHELVLRAPMLWSRIQGCLKRHGISVQTN